GGVERVEVGVEDRALGDHEHMFASDASGGIPADDRGSIARCPSLQRSRSRAGPTTSSTAWRTRATSRGGTRRCRGRSWSATSPSAMGTEFVTVNRGKEYRSVLSTYERPSRLVFDVTGMMDITASFTTTAEGEGTHLRSEFDFRPRGAMKAFFPVMKPM